MSSLHEEATLIISALRQKIKLDNSFKAAGAVHPKKGYFDGSSDAMLLVIEMLEDALETADAPAETPNC